MPISEFQLRQMLDKPGMRKPVSDVPEDASVKELPLHDKIIEHCDAQRPRWKYIRANPVVKSTIKKGAQDFTVFLPGGVTLCIECKSRDGKLDPEQRIWAREMEMLGHHVHLVRSYSEFLSLVAEESKTPTPNNPML